MSNLNYRPGTGRRGGPPPGGVSTIQIGKFFTLNFTYIYFWRMCAFFFLLMLLFGAPGFDEDLNAAKKKAQE